MHDADLQGRLAFVQAAEQLKRVLRCAYTANGRQESTPEHTWRLCLLAMVLQDGLGPLDFERLLKMCVIHDLGEALHGDVPAIAQSADNNKSAQERQDLIELMTPLPAQLQSEFLALWDDYDQAVSPEARVVKALDKLETIIQQNQGQNPPDFNYAFNLTYGQHYTAANPRLAQLRQLVDAQTQQKLATTTRSSLP